MSILTKQQEGLLNLHLQHTPEFRTGLYISEPQLGFSDVFKKPVGPLYNVDMQPGSESYFEEPENFPGPNYSQTAGPLRNIDLDRTKGIISALDTNDPTGQLAENYMNTLRYTDTGDPYQTVQTNTPKYAEFQVDDFDLTPRMDISTVPKEKKEGMINLGYTWGATKDTEGLPQSGRVYINPDLAKYITTNPTSPRNEQLIDASDVGMGYAKPIDLMNKAVDTIQHEYAHNILDLPGFENIKKSALNAGVPSNLKLEGPPKYEDIKKREHTNEEMFNRALDIERYYRKHGNMNDANVRMDLNHLQYLLDKKYKNPTDGRWGSALSYVNYMRPQVLKYFNEIDRQGKMGWINKQKTKRGMPEHLGDAGQSLDDMSGVKKTVVPIHSPHGGGPGTGGGGYRASRPTSERRSTGHGKSGMGRDKSKLMARGGLIDIPLPGRSRDI